jgi:type IV secretory pathway VirB4 component
MNTEQISIKKIINELKKRNLTVQLSAQLFEIFKMKNVSAAVIASLIGVNPRVISKFYQAGIIDREPDGNYNLIKALNQYIEHVKGTKKKVMRSTILMIKKGFCITRPNRKRLKLCR